MSELPQGWEKTSLGDVTNVIRGITFPATAKEYQKSDDNVCCLRTSNIQREINWEDIYFVSRDFVKRNEQLVKAGDILMSMANSYELVGKVAVVRNLPFTTAYGAFLAAIRPTSVINGQYLFHLLRTDFVQGELRKGSSQTTNIANISASSLVEVEIPLAPLAEQKRIADKLDILLARVDATRVRLDRIPELLRRFRQSVLAAATSGQLTEDWRQEQQAKASAQSVAPIHHGSDSDLPPPKGQVEPPHLDAMDSSSKYVEINEFYRVPAAWEIVTMDSLSDLITSGSRGWADYYSKSGAIFIRAQNINSDKLNLDDVAYVKLPEKAEGKRATAELDDLLVTITGANVGKSARVDVALNEAYVSQHVALIKLKNKRSAKYVELFLWAESSGRGQLNVAAYGGGKPGLSLSNVRTLVIGIPSVNEQNEIVRRVESLFALVDKIEARYTSARASVDRLTPSVLAKAFRGELVPQSPDDESADIFLRRIKMTK